MILEMAFVQRGNAILLLRNPARGLMGGLYELPHSGIPGTSSLFDRHGGALLVDAACAARFRHTVTHHRIEARVFPARLRAGRRLARAVFRTVPELVDLPLGGLTRKALRALGLPA
jgi:adenine-specific DNA glycosylase